MKNEILELFKAYEVETEWENNVIHESMFNALADDIVKLYSKTNIKHIRIIGTGFNGIICGIDEARTIFIRDENILKYPELPIIDLEFLEDSERYLGEFVIPLEKFEPLNVAIKRATEAFKSLGVHMIDHSYQEKKKHKGYERPYKYHR